MKRKKEEEK